MPVFTFEKISSSGHDETVPVVVTRPRGGVIVQMLDRLTENRLQREARRVRLAASFTEADITAARTRDK